MSKKCRAYSESRLGLEPSDNRKAFYAGWDAALRERLAEQPAPVAAVNTSSERVDKTEENVHEQPAQQPVWPEHELRNAIGLMRQQDEQNGFGNFAVAIKALEGLLEAPQPAQQEPMAWMHNNIEGNVIAHRPIDIDRHPERWTALYPEPKPCPTCEALARTVMMDQTAHDTPPASKPWVGLTQQDINIAFDDTQEGGGFDDFARAIEAKLREKNA